jgi:hypothetical protein
MVKGEECYVRGTNLGVAVNDESDGPPELSGLAAKGGGWRRRRKGCRTEL